MERVALMMMENLRIILPMFQYPSDLRLDSYSQDLGIRESAKRQIYNNIDHLGQEVKEERKRIIDQQGLYKYYVCIVHQIMS